MWLKFLYYLFLIKSVKAIIPQQCFQNDEMIDASGNMPSGILTGNLIDLGSYDQCFSIKQQNGTEILQGKYCLIRIIVEELFKDKEWSKKRTILQGIDPDSIKPRIILGWCIPEQCQPENISINLSIKTLGNIEVVPEIVGKCQTEDDLNKKFTASDWGVITFFIIILIIMIISTFYDVYLHFTKKRPAYLLFTAFSVQSNGEKLLSVNSNPDQLPFLHGIRFITMLWIVLAHRYNTIMSYPLINFVDVKDWIYNPFNMYIFNAAVSVDTFFVLSGLLLGYGFCLSKSKGVKFNFINFCIHRYLRLTPVLAVVVLIHATIYPYFGSGPFWPMKSTEIQAHCKNYWWTTLLYIQNYYNIGKICVGQSWYLSLDMQLYIISPLILIPLWRTPKKTLIISTILIILSMIIPFLISYYLYLPGIVYDIDAETTKKFFVYYYCATYARYGPWLMGLIFGYYLFNIKKSKRKIKMKPIFVIIGWMIALLIMLISLFAGHGLITNKDRIANSFFNGMHRHAWSLGLCWVIFACSVGYGGVVNSFLSWSVFQVLGRFTYTIYLVHLTLQMSLGNSSRTNIYFKEFYFLFNFWGDLFISLAISICLSLAFECPFITIEKILFGKKNFDAEKNKSASNIEIENMQENPELLQSLYEKTEIISEEILNEENLLQIKTTDSH